MRTCCCVRLYHFPNVYIAAIPPSHYFIFIDMGGMMRLGTPGRPQCTFAYVYWIPSRSPSF